MLGVPTRSKLTVAGARWPRVRVCARLRTHQPGAPGERFRPFWGRFFESGHYAHIVTRMHVPVAPAACDLTRPGAAPIPARRGSPPPAPGLWAKARGRSDPWAAVR